SALKTYTRYLETLKSGAARIDLEGDPVGTVTAADEEDAKQKIAKAARRAAVKAIEDRQAAGQPSAKPVAKRAGQQNPISKANSQQPTPTQPQRLGLADLEASARLAERGSSPRSDPGSMALELADLGRDRPPYTTEFERAAEVCDSGSDLSEP